MKYNISLIVSSTTVRARYGYRLYLTTISTTATLTHSLAIQAC